MCRIVDTSHSSREIGTLHGSCAERDPAAVSADLQVTGPSPAEPRVYHGRAARLHDLRQKYVFHLPDPHSFHPLTSHQLVIATELIPSSARATAPSASPLPEQLVPLLQDALERIKAEINKVLPVSKPRNALEEAEWEDEGDEGALDREIMLQCTRVSFSWVVLA